MGLCRYLASAPTRRLGYCSPAFAEAAVPAPPGPTRAVCPPSASEKAAPKTVAIARTERSGQADSFAQPRQRATTRAEVRREKKSQRPADPAGPREPARCGRVTSRTRARGPTARAASPKGGRAGAKFRGEPIFFLAYLARFPLV